MSIDRREFFYKLNSFEKHFPNKDFINLNDAMKFIEKVLKVKVNELVIKDYLKLKGYINIYEEAKGIKNEDESNDDLDINDILKLEFKENLSNKKENLNKKNNSNYAISHTAISNDELLKLYNKDKDPIIFSRLVENNSGLVNKAAYLYLNYMGHDLSYEDLVQEGTLGLMKAIERFDLSFGNQFSTYATHWIRQKIVRAIIDKGTTVRVPVHMIESIRKIKKTELEVFREYNCINVDEITKRLSICKDNYYSAKLVEHRYLNMKSLNTIVSENDSDTELLEFYSGDSLLINDGYLSEVYRDPTELFEIDDRNRKLREILAQLDKREQFVIKKRYGLDDDHFKTLEEVGKMLGVTRERVRQIEAKAIKRLRRRMDKGKNWVP